MNEDKAAGIKEEARKRYEAQCGMATDLSAGAMGLGQDPREKYIHHLEAAKSKLIKKLADLQKLQDRIRWANPTELEFLDLLGEVYGFDR